MRGLKRTLQKKTLVCQWFHTPPTSRFHLGLTGTFFRSFGIMSGTSGSRLGAVLGPFCGLSLFCMSKSQVSRDCVFLLGPPRTIFNHLLISSAIFEPSRFHLGLLGTFFRSFGIMSEPSGSRLGEILGPCCVHIAFRKLQHKDYKVKYVFKQPIRTMFRAPGRPRLLRTILQHIFT